MSTSSHLDDWGLAFGRGPNRVFTRATRVAALALLLSASVVAVTAPSAGAAPLPVLSVAGASVLEGNAGTRTVRLAVSLSQPAASSVTAHYATTSGTATSGTDFTAASGTVTVPPGAGGASIDVPVTGDTSVEPNETFSVTLSAPSGATIGTASATVTILNDDASSGVQVGVAAAAVVEGNAGSRQLWFPVTLSETAGVPVSVTYGTAAGTATAGSDFASASGTLAIPPGNTTGFIPVSIPGDLTLEPSETFSLNLTSPVGASFVTGRATATGTIVTDDISPSRAFSWGTNDTGALGAAGFTTSWINAPRQLGTATWSTVSTNPSGNAMHVVAVQTNGTLWAWGNNGFGQVGDGTVTERHVPTRVGIATTWASVTAGFDSSLAIGTDGKLWAWGVNEQGQLGLGLTFEVHAPTRVDLATNWKAVATGFVHTLGVKTDGSLWAWGDNTSGQLGDGTRIERDTPVRIGIGVDWSGVAAGDAHTVAVKTDHSLWAWGSNDRGQLGDVSTTSRLVPTRAGAVVDWSQVTAGIRTTVGVKVSPTPATLWEWGDNTGGALGFPIGRRLTPGAIGTTGIGPWKALAATFHAAAVKGDGTLWAWGPNSNGQLGDGTVGPKNTPQQIGSATTWATVAVGASHTVAVRADGTLWAWGYNGYGQLGDGTTTSQLAPKRIGIATNWKTVRAGFFSTVALKTDGSLWAWGDNSVGELGDGTTVERHAPVHVGTSTWKAIDIGDAHTVGVKTDGSLLAWGDNSAGQLGDGTVTGRLAPVHIGIAVTWKTVAAGALHTLGERTDGTLWAWGDNTFGELGDGTGLPRHAPVKIGTATNWSSISAGTFHTGATRLDGSLWAWGDNSAGQLGDGTATSRLAPVRIGAALDWNGVVAADRVTLGLRN